MGDAGVDDAFDRVVQREEKLRRRWLAIDEPRQCLKLIVGFYAVCALAWGLVLAGHGAWVPDPLWVFRVHAVVYAVVVALGVVTIGGLALVVLLRPEWLGIGTHD